MSQKNREGKRQARERLAEERRRAEQRRQRTRRMAAGGIAVVVIIVAVIVGLLVSNSSGGSTGFPSNAAYVPPNGTLTGAEVAASSVNGGAGQDGIAIGYGPSNAPVKLTLFEDFRCPVCDAMEKTGVGPAMQQYARDGKIQVQYHIASFIDRNDGGSGSKQAANAAACAMDAGVDYFIAYHNVLYANQPSETDDGFGDVNNLLNLAQKVPGLVTPTFTQCVKTDAHAGWVTASQTDFDNRGIQGTPTGILDGATLPLTSNSGVISVPQLDQLINAELAKKGAAPETPTPTGIPAPTVPLDSPAPTAVPSTAPTPSAPAPAGASTRSASPTAR